VQSSQHMLEENKTSIYNLNQSLTGLSTSWEAANCAPTQELPSILWNPKVHYHVHKSPLLVPILSHINPIHTTSFSLYKIHFNIIRPPTSWSSQWSLSFWLSHQYTICIPCLTHSCYISCQFYILFRRNLVFKGLINSAISEMLLP
jgi:hypothetical protein